MRIITQKDRKGLLKALRVFIRAMSGERISQQAGDAMLDFALHKGLSFDEILNKGNWARALEITTDLTAREYIDILAAGDITILKIKEEPLWHDVNDGFPVVAEAAHDFFMEVSGRGGKWNIPSALTNLAKAIRDHSLQAILSEKLINEVVAGDEEMTYFGYVLAIAKDFGSLNVDDTPTEAQAARAARETGQESHDETVTGESEGQGAGQTQDDEPDNRYHPEDDQPEDDPYPENPEGETYPAERFETTFITDKNPRDMKRDCLWITLENYTPKELLGLVQTIEGGESMPISDIIDCLTDGKFDPSKETPETRGIHQNISADLMPSFIESVRYQGIEMDETLATNYDILRDSWDLRTPEVRKLHKLKRLIVSYGQEDPDLLAAIQDIEDLYSE